VSEREIDKLIAAHGDAFIIGEFIDWLGESGYRICAFQEFTRHSGELGDCTPAGWYPQRKSYEQLLADYFEIDLKKVEEERREILESIRHEHEGA